MMFKFEDGVFYLTKGDDASFKVELSIGEELYEMQEGDKLALTVRTLPSENGELIFYTKSDTNEIKIEHGHTKNSIVGQYSADIQLTTASGEVHTVFPTDMDNSLLKAEKNWKNFWITPEVTLWS